MSTRICISLICAAILCLFSGISVQAQTDPFLTVNVFEGIIEISTDDGTTYAEVINGQILEPGDHLRWSENGVGKIEGPDSLQVVLNGPELGTGELRLDSVDDPEVSSGISLQQIAGEAIYARENDRAELDAFLALSDEDQMLECTSRQADNAAFTPDPQAVAAEANEPLEDAALKIIDQTGESYGLLASGWLFMGVNENGQFTSQRWTMDANFETQILGLRLRRDTTQPDYTIIDRYCQGIALTDSTATIKDSFASLKPLELQQDPLSFVIPEPGTAIEYTIDPETGAITITMSPGGQASFLIPEGGLPAGVTILVDGFTIELDTTQAGSVTITSGGDGQISATGTGGGATITSPQGVVVVLSSPDSAAPAQAAITDIGTGAVVVQPLAGSVDLQTNGVQTTVTFPDGSIIDVPPGDSYALTVAIEANGAVQVTADPANPAPLLIQPASLDDGTTPPPPITVVPGGQTGPICPGGVQPSGVGGACPPV